MLNKSLNSSNALEACAEIVAALRDTTVSDSNNPVHFGFQKGLHYLDSPEVSQSKMYSSEPFSKNDFIRSFFETKFRYVSHTTSYKQKKFITLDELHTTTSELRIAIEKHCLSNQTAFANILKAHKAVLKIIEQHLVFFSSAYHENGLFSVATNDYIKNFSNGKVENHLNLTPCLNKSIVECKLLILKKCIISLDQSENPPEVSVAQLNLCRNLVALISLTISRLDLSATSRVIDFTFLHAEELHSKKIYNPISELNPQKILWFNRGYSVAEFKDASVRVLENCNSVCKQKDFDFSKFNFEISTTYKLIIYGLLLLSKSSNNQPWLTKDLKNYWVKISEKNIDKFNTQTLNQLINNFL